MIDHESGLIVTCADWQNIDESEYVGMKPRGTRLKLKMSYKSFMKRVKPSWSTNDLLSAYGSALTAPPRRPEHEPLKHVDERMYLARREDGSSLTEFRPMPPSPPALSLEEKCRDFLDEKLAEQLQKKKFLLPKACYIYGDMCKHEIPLDTSKEVYADYSVCAVSAHEQNTFRAERLRWEADKARGVHFPSVLKVRRKELSVALQKAAKANVKIIPNPSGHVPFRALKRKKCANCKMPGPVVPPGLKPSDWLPLVYLQRSRHCEHQRPNLEESMWAHEVVVSHAMSKHTPSLSVWTCRRSRRHCLGPSPLSKSIVPGAEVADANSESISEADSSSTLQHDVDDKSEAQPLASDSSDSADSSSVCSLDQPETDSITDYVEPESPSTATYRIIEVRDLHWVKKYRVPSFPPPNKEHHRSTIAEAVLPAEEKVVEKTETIESPPPKKQYDFDKPLPPLPLFATSDSPRDDPVRRRALRRSRSEHLDIILGAQRLKPALAQITPLD